MTGDPYTTIPNWLIEAMPQMPASVFQVACVIARQTFGYEDKSSPTGRREWDRISVSQFQQATGLSRQGVQDAIGAGLNKWFVRREVGQSFQFQLCNSVDHATQLTMQDSSTVPCNSFEQLDTKPCNSVDPQKKEEKKERKAATATDIVWNTWLANMPGTMTPIIKDAIDDMRRDYGEAEIVEAIKIAVKRNRRSLGYVQGVLSRGVDLGKSAEQNAEPMRLVFLEQ